MLVKYNELIMQKRLLRTQAASTPIKRTESVRNMAVEGSVQFSSSCSLKPNAVQCITVYCCPVQRSKVQ